MNSFAVDTLGFTDAEIEEDLVQGTHITWHHRPATPEQALKLLPEDASPAQKDSIIQHYFKPVVVQPSSRPDTLSLPGLESKPFELDNVPQYKKEGFFAKNPYLHPELKVDLPGVAGDPVPYQLRSDIFITSTLLISFFFAVFIVSRSLHVFLTQMKNLLYNRDRNEAIMLSRDNEMKTQTYVNLLACFLLGILFFNYTEEYLPNVFNRMSPYKLLVLNMAVLFGYFLLKMIAYRVTNWTFFDSQDNEQWGATYNLLTLTKVMAYFPITLVVVYFDIPVTLMLWLVAGILTLFEIMVLFKAKQIFFSYKFGVVHLFLYFCTLELVPVIILWLSLITANELTIVYI